MASGRSWPMNLCLNHVLPYWRTWVVILTPIVLLPVPLMGTQEALTGYIVLIMALYWMTEALPLPVTSLLPIVTFPLLGIMNTGQVCMNYFSETVVMFIGGLMVGLAVEYSNLHKRIALKVLLSVGTDPKWLMMGFMSVTMGLSMFVSNTGACAMICPIVEALVEELYNRHGGVPHPLETVDEVKVPLTGDQQPVVIDEEPTKKYISAVKSRRLRVTLLLSVAYAANIGGTGTLIGSTPQLALKGIVEELYGTDTELTFSTWMAVLMPAVLISTLLTWVWLQYLLSGSKCRKGRDEDEEGAEIDQNGRERAKNLILTKYRELGPMSFNEKTVTVLFSILVLLWLFRDPKFIPGWGSFFSKKIGDSVPVLWIILILFVLPVKPDFWCFRSNRSSSSQMRPRPSKAMLTWQFMHDKLPWGLVLLLGSGFAVSDASKVSGLSNWMGSQLSALNALPHFAILIIVCLITTWTTEVVSNTATANIVLPILAQMAETIKVNPLYLMVPAAATCCYTFVLPVGTPANAIVYNSAKMSPLDMAKAGVVTKMMTVLVLVVVMETLGKTLFPVHLVSKEMTEILATNLTTGGNSLT